MASSISAGDGLNYSAGMIDYYKQLAKQYTDQGLSVPSYLQGYVPKSGTVSSPSPSNTTPSSSSSSSFLTEMFGDFADTNSVGYKGFDNLAQLSGTGKYATSQLDLIKAQGDQSVRIAEAVNFDSGLS